MRERKGKAKGRNGEALRDDLVFRFESEFSVVPHEEVFFFEGCKRESARTMRRYVVGNRTGADITVNVEVGETWLKVAPRVLLILAHKSQKVAVGLNGLWERLDAGFHSSRVTFTEERSGAVEVRRVVARKGKVIGGWEG